MVVTGGLVGSASEDSSTIVYSGPSVFPRTKPGILLSHGSFAGKHSTVEARFLRLSSIMCSHASCVVILYSNECC